MRPLLWLALLAGCPTATTGTVDLELTTAPGSSLLDAVTTLRVTLTSPRQVVEATRTDAGFALALEVEASGDPGAVVVEGFDPTGTLVAAGQSPEFSIAAIDARIVVYMARPLSIERAPLSLTPARTNVGAGPLTYGAVFAGGRDPVSSAPSDALVIYNAYDHSIAGGKPLPAPRDGVVVATTASGIIYLFGGRDGGANPTGTYWLFDSTFAPSGRYIELGDQAGFPRADQTAISLGLERFLITGTPPLETSGAVVNERSDVPGLSRAAAVSVAANGARTVMAIDTTGRLVRFRDDTVDVIASITRLDAAIAALPDGRFVVIGGGTADEQNDLVVVDPATGIGNVLADALAEAHAGASVAVTRRHVVVVGGGAATEVFDVTTLARVTTSAPLAGPAVTLPNDQVLIAGSEGDLSLFTPPPPLL